MKRREFLRRTFLTGAVVATVGVAVAVRKTDQLSLETIRTMVRHMKSGFVPVEDYYAIVHPEEEGFQKLLNGEIGRYESIRFIPQTQLPLYESSDFGKEIYENLRGRW